MKKITILLLTIFVHFLGFAQTIVSTTAENRKVVLEEFTGVDCQYCPDGHRIAANYKATNPNNISIINIHTGGYATKYKTAFGEALANQSGLDGYPSGTINRHIFTGNASALNRGNWVARGNQILNMPSFVNIAAEATINTSTNVLTVHVEVYYTGNANTASNRLNVAILQNNILGNQLGASYNPSQVVGSQYRHMHMLRHLFTGQWGEELLANPSDNVITAGSFFDKTYQILIPSQYGITGDMLNTVLTELEVVAFIAEDTDEIYTGITAIPTQISTIPSYVSVAVDGLSSGPYLTCSDSAKVYFTLKNTSSISIDSLRLRYGIVGETLIDYSFVGTINSMEDQLFELPIHLVLGANPVSVILDVYKINDSTNTFINLINSKNTSKPNIIPGQGQAQLILRTDIYASETTWKLKDLSGNILQQNTTLSNSTLHNIPLTGITTDGCYIFEIKDSYGDGLLSNAYYQIIDGYGTTLLGYNGNYGSGESRDFNIANLLPYSDDITILSITSPVSEVILTSDEQVTINVKNNGQNVISSLTLELVVDGGTAQTETWTGNIASLATQSITLTNTADLSASGSHTITVTAILTGDENNTNDSQTINITNCIAKTLPFTESFESATFPPDCWNIIDGDGDGYNWVIYNNAGTAHTGNKTALSQSYINGLGALTPANYLVTPEISIPANAQTTLSFWVKGSDPAYASEKYSIKISTTSNNSISAFTPISSNNVSTATYTKKTIDLSSYAGQEVFIAFVHENITNMFALCLDDISIDFETNVTCNLENATITNENNVLTANVEGAQGNLTYVWSTEETTETITAIESGTYSVTITDDITANCTATASILVNISSINESENSSFNVYPNPSTGLINITVKEKSNVEVYDITGKLLENFYINAEETRNLKYSAGVYFVKVNNKVKKLIIR